MRQIAVIVIDHLPRIFSRFYSMTTQTHFSEELFKVEAESNGGFRFFYKYH